MNFDKILSYFQIKHIIIDACENLNTQEIIKSNKLSIGGNIFDYDIVKIHEKLCSNGWVKSAIVQRRLPDTLYIRISEKIPIAIWQLNHKIYLIDELGDTITQNLKNFTDLPVFVGQNANKNANNLLNILNKYPHIKSQLKFAKLIGNRRFDIQTKDNLLIKCEEKNICKSLNIVEKLYADKINLAEKYCQIDLRVNDRIVLKKIEKVKAEKNKKK